MKQVSIALRTLIVMGLLTGVIYPLGVTVAGKILYNEKAAGSFLKQNDALVGSELIAQKFEQKKYFWPRPSAADYNPMSSGGSNLGPTSSDLKKQVDERIAKISKTPNSTPPQDLLFASGSGLDPHISPEAAEYQIERISSERGLDVTTLHKLVVQLTERPQFGILGEARVNVLKLNLALDRKGLNN